MKGEIRAGISAVAAAVMLVACASKGPVSSTGQASADAKDETSAEYQRLIDNAGKEPLICKRKAVTGSRVDRQVCLTRSEMEEQRERGEEVMRDIRSSAALRQQLPNPPPSTPRSTP
jgi:hypothetical protein